MRRDRASREDAAERPPPVKRGDKSGGAAEKESMFALKKKPDEVSDGSLVRMLREGLEDSSSDEEREDEEGGKEQGQEAAPNRPKLKMRPNVARKNSSAARKQERGKTASAAQGAHQDTAGGKSVKKMTLTEEEAAMNGAPGTWLVLMGVV